MMRLIHEFSGNSYRIMYCPDSFKLITLRFFENLSEEGLMVIGRHYGLGPNDLWKATRRINLPEVISDEAKQCM
jgi:hypothetical protein